MFTVSATKTAKFVDTNTLPSNGTYKLTVDPNSTYTGKVTLPALQRSAGCIRGCDVRRSSPAQWPTTVPGQNAYVTFDGARRARIALKLSGVTVTAGSVTVLDPNDARPRSAARLREDGQLHRPDRPDSDRDLQGRARSEGPSTRASVTVTAYDVPADTSAALTLGTPGHRHDNGSRRSATRSPSAGHRTSASALSVDLLRRHRHALAPEARPFRSRLDDRRSCRRVPRHDRAPGRPGPTRS